MKYFKRPEPGGFNYYELSEGSQTVISFLDNSPTIGVFHVADNPFINEAVLEVGIRIEKSEYQEAYKIALNHQSVEIHT